MRTPSAILLALLSLSACKRSETPATDPFPVKSMIGDVPLIDFDFPEAGFFCLAPRNWSIQPSKHLDARKGAAFIADSRGISILRYPESESQWNDAQKYAESFWMIDANGKQPEVTKEKSGDNTVYRFHQERAALIPHTRKHSKPVRYDYALFPIKGGFFEIMHQAPADDYQSTLPVFEAVVRSFRPTDESHP